jgi:hypothetical protein
MAVSPLLWSSAGGHAPTATPQIRPRGDIARISIFVQIDRAGIGDKGSCSSLAFKDKTPYIIF